MQRKYSSGILSSNNSPGTASNLKTGQDLSIADERPRLLYRYAHQGRPLAWHETP
jgi:hypothetical protein